MALTRPRPLAVLSGVVGLGAPSLVVAALLLPVAAAPVAFAGSLPSRPAVADLTPHLAPVAPAAPAAPVEVAAPAPVRRTAVAVRHRAPRPAAVRPVVRAAGPQPVRKAAPAPAPVAAPAPQPAPKPAPAPARTGGDDYPYRTDTTNGPDRWGFTMRQCVSFAAWRLAQAGKALDNASEHWDSALTWDDVARSRGVAVSSTPRVGAIAHWNAGESSAVSGGTFTAGSYGHVGYVAAVYADGWVLVEQYNLGGNRSYSSMKMKAPRYLLF